MSEQKVFISNIRSILNRLPVPTLIVGGMWVFILILGTIRGPSLSVLLTDTLRRFSMWGLLVLAMMPSIQSGAGPNFAQPSGIVCGLLALVCSIELGLTGVWWLIVSVMLATAFAAIIGYLYGLIINAVKGSEMAFATYSGFSTTYLFCILWMVLPFRSPIISWTLGSGLRNTIELKQIGGTQLLNNFLNFEIYGINFPTGMLLVFAAACLYMWLFFRSKMGIAISAVGINPMFAKASGLNVNKYRIIANIISTILTAVGIIIYSQSFGFAALYDALLMMSFQAVACILIGGATTQKATIMHAVVGTIIYQGLMANAPPVLNNLFPETDLSEIIRMVVQNGIILYALTHMKRNV